METKKLIIIFSWPRSGTHLLWSKITQFTDYIIGHDFPVLPLFWHSYKNKNNSKFVPNLPNPWKEKLDFNMSQNYGFFVNSSNGWIDKNSFLSSEELLRRISKNINYNLKLNDISILELFKTLVFKNRSNKLLLVNRFPYTTHYPKDTFLKFHSDEWTILDAINSTKFLLDFCKNINVSTKIICMIPDFKNVFFKRSIMFKNSVYNSITDYISLTNFISYFYNDSRFCFINSKDLIKLVLSKDHFNEDELLSELINIKLSGENTLETVFSNIIFPKNKSVISKKNIIKHKLKRSFQWLNDNNQYSRAPLTHSLDKNFIRMLRFNRKYREKYLSDISFSYADKGCIDGD